MALESRLGISQEHVNYFFFLLNSILFFHYQYKDTKDLHKENIILICKRLRIDYKTFVATGKGLDGFNFLDFLSTGFSAESGLNLGWSYIEVQLQLNRSQLWAQYT